MDWILHFVFCDKILQTYRQHWLTKFYRHILSKIPTIFKKWGEGCYIPSTHPLSTPLFVRPILLTLYLYLSELNKRMSNSNSLFKFLTEWSISNKPLRSFHFSFVKKRQRKKKVVCCFKFVVSVSAVANQGRSKLFHGEGAK